MRSLTETNSLDDIKILESGMAKFAILGLLNTCLCLLVPVLIGYFILVTIPTLWSYPWFFLIIPLCVGLVLIMPLTSLAITKMSLSIVNWRYPPREGSFDIDVSVRDTRAWIYRRGIKALSNNLRRLFKWNWLTVLTLRTFGLKVGKNVKLYGEVVDDPFIEIGDNVILGKRAVIAGHLYDNYKITFNKTVIGNNCIIEPVAGAVGATLGDHTIIRKGCGALRGQRTRGNGCFEGVPMRRVTPEVTQEEYEKSKKLTEDFNNRDLDKEKLAPIKISTLKLWGVKLLSGGVGLLAASGMGIFYYYLVFSPLYFQVASGIGQFLALLLMPLFIIIALGFFLVFNGLVAKCFMTSIPEGTYEMNSEEAKAWKFSYLLKKYCIRLVDATVIDLIDVYFLKLFGNKIGRNTIVKEGIVDPEYLDFGDFVTIAVLARVHTHNVIDGKLVLKGVKIGEKVVVGGVAHLDVGSEIGPGSILGIATYIKPNRRLKGNNLWMGNPATNFPKTLLKKIWIEPEKGYI